MSGLEKMKNDEWLEPDGLGGFACGTVCGIRTRRYHALLLTATKPPAGRIVLVNGVEAFVETSAGTYALSSNEYPAQVLYPDGFRRILGFHRDPWPQWTYQLEDGTKIHQEIFVVKGSSMVCLCWRLATPAKCALTIRPLLSGRDYHSLHHENSVFQFQPHIHEHGLTWTPYDGIPGIVALHNGAYHHQPEWYRNFIYEEERARGLDFSEDLASPGLLRWDMGTGEAVLIFAAEGGSEKPLPANKSAEQIMVHVRATERRRRASLEPLWDRSADDYLVKRGKGKTTVAGYPWFTDWGRDTFISLRGLCLATQRLEDARDILLEWSGVVSDGMLPNLFPDQADAPEYNSVDASLWYIIAVHDFLEAADAHGRRIQKRQKENLRRAIESILTGYCQGTRYNIRMDEDRLLAAGVPGVQLTWMDAKVGDWVVTPRIGKPVEVQALWLNALWIGSQFSERWRAPFTRGCESFRARFWHEGGGYLYDVIDADHQPGRNDALFRPNQIFAVGGLPLQLLDGERANRVVHSVEGRLWTPLGLRSLAPEEPGYVRRYEGGVRERDGAYHQGTVWPWLIGPFVEAWVRVHGGTAGAKKEARKRFLAPILQHLRSAGLGHVSEIADAEPPHAPRGCPFQAWSLAEAIRLDRVVLAERPTADTSIGTHAIGI